MKKLICGEQLVKCFKEGLQERLVLDHVSVAIYEGEFVAVMGPSGSGKSTLMFALSGMDTIEGGKVVFEEKLLVSLKEKERAELRRSKMGFVFQQPTFLKNLNILDNIILPVIKDQGKNKEMMVQKARVLMKETDIQDLEKRDITEVSGGQLQRAGICRALMSQPKIIFADEPTGALNSKMADEVMTLFGKVNRLGTAVMLVTHDAKVAARAERVLFMQDGKIASELKLDKFQEKSLESRVKQIDLHMKKIGI